MLQGSLIARKGEAAPAGGDGRPPVSVPRPPGVVDGRLGYRLQVGPGKSRAERSPRLDEPPRADRRADLKGFDAVRAANIPGHQPREAAVAQPGIGAGEAQLPMEGGAAVRSRGETSGANRVSNGADARLPRSSDEDAGLSSSANRRDPQRNDAGRVRSKAGADSAGHGRHWSSVPRRHVSRSRPRRHVGRLALLAGAVALLAVGVGLYDGLGAPQQMVRAIQETLTNAFGSAAPLLAEGVGVSEGALVGRGENRPAPVGVVVRPEAVLDLSADVVEDTADLDSDGVVGEASSQPSPAAAGRAAPVSASLPSPSTKVGLGSVRGGEPGVAAAPPEVQLDFSLKPADADKLPIALASSSAAVAIDTSGSAGTQANEPVSVTVVRLDARVGFSADASPPKAVVVEAPLSAEAALSTSEALARLGVPNGRAATPISKPLDRVRRAAVVAPESAAPLAAAPYAVQIASYRSSELAAQAAAKLTKAHLEQLGSGAAGVVPGPGGLFRVMSARMEKRGDAISLCNQLKTRGQDCLVVKR